LLDNDAQYGRLQGEKADGTGTAEPTGNFQRPVSFLLLNFQSRRTNHPMLLADHVRMFADLLSEGHMPGFWHLMRSFYDGDTYPALPASIKLLDQLVRKIQAENPMVTG